MGQRVALAVLTRYIFHTGCRTVEAVNDLWWHPLLGAKWAALVRDYTFTVMPMEVVLPGKGGPRHECAGLAIFTLRHEGDRVPELCVGDALQNVLTHPVGPLKRRQDWYAKSWLAVNPHLWDENFVWELPPNKNR